jgi:hypothetical protein
MAQHKNTKKNNNTDLNNTCDKMYHDTETFLYIYRWWIILVLTCMLAYYIHMRKCDTRFESGFGSGIENVMPEGRKLLVTDLALGDPAVGMNTAARSFFKL